MIRTYSKGPSIKASAIRNGVCTVLTLCGQEEASLDTDVRTFWTKKLRIFRNFWCVRSDKEGGFSQCGHFSDKGEGSIFPILCGRLL